ncbi:hypothetical protein B4135_4198 [Caldibacillus debilis]|uniref:Uncharacterized protein n=1 Tax=Caldibacillus debilis TaxID=301148 RepID=A0A150L6U9_9BACI|nr:hypothetical protein B4135_4198 [Caldibacillus debilis]
MERSGIALCLLHDPKIDLQEQKGGTKRLLQKKERGVRKPNKDWREHPIPFPRKTFSGPSCARPAPSGAELRSSALGRIRTHISRTGIFPEIKERQYSRTFIVSLAVI